MFCIIYPGVPNVKPSSPACCRTHLPASGRGTNCSSLFRASICRIPAPPTRDKPMSTSLFPALSSTRQPPKIGGCPIRTSFESIARPNRIPPSLAQAAVLGGVSICRPRRRLKSAPAGRSSAVFPSAILLFFQRAGQKPSLTVMKVLHSPLLNPGTILPETARGTAFCLSCVSVVRAPA